MKDKLFVPAEKTTRMSAFSARVVNADLRRIRVVMSSEMADDHNTVIRARGLDLDARFKENPVVFWAHEHSTMPVAKVFETSFGEVTGRLNGQKKAFPAMFGDLDFPDRKTYAYGHLVYRMYAGGFLRGVSIGFLPLKQVVIEEVEELISLGLRPPMGAVIEKGTMYELSAAPLPSNPGALAVELASFCRSMKLGITTRDWADFANPDIRQPDEKFVSEFFREQFAAIQRALDSAGGSRPVEIPLPADPRTLVVNGTEAEAAALLDGRTHVSEITHPIADSAPSQEVTVSAGGSTMKLKPLSELSLKDLTVPEDPEPQPQPAPKPITPTNDTIPITGHQSAEATEDETDSEDSEEAMRDAIEALDQAAEAIAAARARLEATVNHNGEAATPLPIALRKAPLPAPTVEAVLTPDGRMVIRATGPAELDLGTRADVAKRFMFDCPDTHARAMARDVRADLDELQTQVDELQVEREAREIPPAVRPEGAPKKDAPRQVSILPSASSVRRLTEENRDALKRAAQVFDGLYRNL